MGVGNIVNGVERTAIYFFSSLDNPVQTLTVSSGEDSVPHSDGFASMFSMVEQWKFTNNLVSQLFPLSTLSKWLLMGLLNLYCGVDQPGEVC